jgi:hypothetical protein
MEVLSQTAAAGLPGAQIPVSGDPGAVVRRGADDPLSTVGLALLAYGLVQLLSKFIDKIGFGRSVGEQRSGVMSGGFTEEDKKRLERTCDLLANGDQRLQRIAESGATQQKLVGQVLDELRESGRKQELLVRKLNAVLNRIGSRNDDSR